MDNLYNHRMDTLHGRFGISRRLETVTIDGDLRCSGWSSCVCHIHCGYTAVYDRRLTSHWGIIEYT